MVSQLVNTTVAPTAIDQKEEGKSSMTVGIVITNRIFYPSDLVNAKTTIPLRVGEERWIYTSTLRVSVYIHHYSPSLRGIVV